MSITQKDTKSIVQALVKALDPKFKKIDQRFNKIDERFTGMSLEIGDMIAPLATKAEIDSLKGEMDERFDDAEESFNQFAGSMGVFQSRVTQCFDQVDEDHKEHGKLIKLVYDQVESHSSHLRDQDRRIEKLEKTA